MAAGGLDSSRGSPLFTNPPGRMSLGIAIGVTALSLVQQVVSYLVPALMGGLGWSAAGIGALFTVFSVVTGVAAVVGLVMGILGLGRFGAPKGAAAAGTAVAAFVLLNLLSRLAAEGILGVVYS